MGVGENLVVSGRSAEVPCRHAVVATLIDASIGQHRHGHGVGIGGVGPQVRVGVSYQRVAHGAIGVGLVGEFRGVVLRGIRRALHGAQRVELQPVDGLVGQLALHLEFVGIDLHVVVLQFLEDVERGEVSCVRLVGVEHP